MRKSKIFLPVLIFAVLLTLHSCSDNDRKKTFLDFEYGMTSEEFSNHANDLQKSKIISNLNGNTFEYAMSTLNDKHAYFKCRAFVYKGIRLTSIRCELKYSMSNEERDAIINSLTSKYGTPSYGFKVNPYAPQVSNVSWALTDHDVSVTVGNSNPINEFTLEYNASGTLYKNIQKKDKKENGIIDVDNKY